MKVIINNETMVCFGYFFTILTLLSLDEDQIGNVISTHKSVPFTTVMIILFIGCVLHNHKIITIVGSVIIFLCLRQEKENETN